MRTTYPWKLAVYKKIYIPGITSQPKQREGTRLLKREAVKEIVKALKFQGFD